LRIGHVAVTVLSLERTEAFYKDAFGFRTIERFKEGEWEILLLKRDDVVLELFSSRSTLPLPDYRKELGGDLKVCGVKHFAIATPDIREKYRELKEKKIDVVTDIQSLSNGLKYFFVRDPEGIFIEVVEDEVP